MKHTSDYVNETDDVKKDQIVKDSPEQQEHAALDSYLHLRLHLELVRLIDVAKKERNHCRAHLSRRARRKMFVSGNIPTFFRFGIWESFGKENRFTRERERERERGRERERERERRAQPPLDGSRTDLVSWDDDRSRSLFSRCCSKSHSYSLSLSPKVSRKCFSNDIFTLHTLNRDRFCFAALFCTIV